MLRTIIKCLGVKTEGETVQDSLALTVAAGVAVFILSQFFVKFILDPAVSLKEVLGELSHFFLFNQAKITNASGTGELQDGAKMLSAQLLAKKEAIPYYKCFGKLLGLPSEESLVNAATELNYISGLLNENYPGKSGSERATEISKCMERIQQQLKVRVSYISSSR